MRHCEETEFPSFDGARLFYRHWAPTADVGEPRAVVLLHRGHEHSGRVAHLADELNLPAHHFFAWDARGNGRSPGVRGDAPGFEALVRDLDAFVAHIAEAHGIAVENIALVAQSVGAVVAAAWVHDYAPRLRALVLASPAFRVKLYVPLARPALRLGMRLRGNFFVNSYVKPQWLTHDEARIQSYREDPLITPQISVRVLLGLYATARRVIADAEAITVPLQMLVSGADFVVHRGPQDRFYEGVSSAIRERVLLPGFYHDTLGEAGREAALDRLRSFLVARFAEPFQADSQREAHRRGPRFIESERLAWPPVAYSPQALYWGGVRAGLKLGGLLSEGIALGLRTGFDSGSTLDYVYRDQAQGRGPVGRCVDRNYLDAIGWRGIRVRGAHAEELLRLAAGRLREAGQPVHVLDIAAGHGRYVLNALASTTARADSILLRDFSELNVLRGREQIQARGASDIARFERADAFDPASYRDLPVAPTLAIVSGLFELFSDNDQVARALEALGQALAPGAWLVYTGQPWHPQLAFIARALTSHRGGMAWVMRRRSTQEMDELVRAAGFAKLTQRIDPWGIFTVALARRRG